MFVKILSYKSHLDRQGECGCRYYLHPHSPHHVILDKLYLIYSLYTFQLSDSSLYNLVKRKLLKYLSVILVLLKYLTPHFICTIIEPLFTLAL